jgi:hypothetical protein
MGISFNNIKKSTPAIAKRLGVACATVSAGIGGLGYATNLDLYIHIGAIAFMLSVFIPTLFTDEKTVA